MLVLRNDNERKAFMDTYYKWDVLLDDNRLGIKVYGSPMPNGYVLTATTYRSEYGTRPEDPGRTSAAFRPINIPRGRHYSNAFYSDTEMLHWFKNHVPNKVPAGYHPVGDYMYEEDKP